MSDEKRKYRSAAWFAKTDKDGFVHRSWMRNQGLPDHVFDGRPVIGICNTWSELTPCNAHFRQIAESVKRGLGGRWVACGISRHVNGRDQYAAHRHAFSQSGEHGCRRVDPRQPD
jgi:dihydroxyacid dehydratase/phosphogluconate dehydratase